MNLQDDFERWWKCFPRKVGKLAAQREYERARKKASAEDLIAGIARYLEAKPTYADLCHPITFLRQGRWLDEAPRSAVVDYWDWVCPHVEPCGNRSTCRNATLLKRPEKEKKKAPPVNLGGALL